MTNILDRLPSKEDLMSLIQEIRDQDFSFNEDGYIDITVASNGVDQYDWGFQLGDNSYTGQCYFYNHWAIGTIDNETDNEELANDLLDQLEEALAYESLDC
jgi:hypothetical protein